VTTLLTSPMPTLPICRSGRLSGRPGEARSSGACARSAGDGAAARRLAGAGDDDHGRRGEQAARARRQPLGAPVSTDVAGQAGGFAR